MATACAWLSRNGPAQHHRSCAGRSVRGDSRGTAAPPRPAAEGEATEQWGARVEGASRGLEAALPAPV